jgi:uncharacterized lipoprotein NlpE involved in copper resistance/heat shock protein HslJ
LNLRADGVFLLRQTYLGTRDGGEKSIHDLGRWKTDGRTLLLTAGTETLRRFAIPDEQTLRHLDQEGREIASTLNYDLARAATLDPFTDTFRMQGFYVYMADAATLQECLTGKRFPVAMAGDNLRLERAYLGARTAPGAPVLVTFDGHLEMRPGMEANRIEEAIVVDRFERAWPTGSCAIRNPALPLLETRWELTAIGDSPVPALKGRDQPWLQLRRELGRMQGFSGCNRLMGAYEVAAGGLRLKDIATTRMYCVGSMDLEQAIVGALPAVTGYRIDGIELELTGPTGVVARLREYTPPVSAPPGRGVL